MTYNNPRRDAEIDIDVHDQYNVVEIALQQDEYFRQNLWVAVLSDTDEDWDFDRDFQEYLEPDEDTGTAKIPVGQGTVIEVCEAGAVDEPESKTWFSYNLEKNDLYELEDEDAAKSAINQRKEIFESRRGSDDGDGSDDEE